MDRARLTRMQIRVVLTIFRSETARIERRGRGAAGAHALRLLRRRSLELLDHARDELDGEAAAHPELLEDIAAARAVIGADEQASARRARSSDRDQREPENVSAGSRAGRRG